MKLLSIIAGAALSLALLSSQAHAATVFNFSLSGSGHSGSGQITANASGPDFVITGLTGTLDGNAIQSLYAPNGWQGNDNVLKTSAPQLTVAGVSFTTSAGNFNLYYDGIGQFVTPPGYGLYNGAQDDSITFSAAAVPEPAMWAMMLIGIGALGLAMRTQRKFAVIA